MKKIDLATWPRTPLFKSFQSFETACYGFTMELDATKAYAFSKENGISFFLVCLYCFLKANNETPNFRLRLIDGEVYDMENVDAITPIMGQESDIFTIVRIPFQPTLELFIKNAAPMLSSTENTLTKKHLDRTDKADQGVVSLNCNPWFSFTGCQIAIGQRDQTIPVISWGKLKDIDGKKILCYAFQANHMFIDGIHVGQFSNKLETFFNAPEKL